MEVEIPIHTDSGMRINNSKSENLVFNLDEKSQSSGLRRGSKFTHNSSVEESSLSAILEEKSISKDSGVNMSLASERIESSNSNRTSSSEKRKIEIIEEVDSEEEHVDFTINDIKMECYIFIVFKILYFIILLI